MYPDRDTLNISIYTLSDLGDLSNLIGSLSRTIFLAFSKKKILAQKSKFIYDKQI